MVKLPFWLISIFLLCSATAFAQESDSTELLSSGASDYLFGNTHSSKALDTTIDNTYNYYQTGVLGNMGLPSYSLLAAANKPASSSLFNWYNLNNNSDLISENSPLYFSTPKTYTKITAVMGQRVEQYLKAAFSRNIKDNLNVSLFFNRYSCKGFYLQQQTLTTNLLFSSNYKTKNGRWGFGFYGLYNKLKYGLNGGIQNPDQNFKDSSLFTNKQLFPVNFTAYGNARQNIRTSSINFNTFFRLNKDDSVHTSHYLVYEGSWRSSYYLYIDSKDDTASFRNLYTYAPADSHDSSGCKILSNSVLYKVNAFNNSLVLFAGYKNELIWYRQRIADTAVHDHSLKIDTNVYNHIIRAGLQYKNAKHMVNVLADYTPAGFNKNNYISSVFYQYTYSPKLQAQAKVQANSILPSYNLLTYNGTHFYWYNQFYPVATQNADITLSSPRYKAYLGAFVQQQQMPVYFNENALPVQYGGNTFIYRLYAGKDLRLWHIHFNNYINYQQTPNTDIIRLPDWYTQHQLYYEGKWFKKNLWIQIGFQGRYVSGFMANAYMPSTNQFYLQDTKMCGNYMFMDFFINAEIHPVKFFVMASHINQGFMGANYILCPGYPMPDRSIKAGLVWMLFN